MTDTSTFDPKPRCQRAQAVRSVRGMVLGDAGPRTIDQVGASLRHCFAAEKGAANADFADLLARLG